MKFLNSTPGTEQLPRHDQRAYGFLRLLPRSYALIVIQPMQGLIGERQESRCSGNITLEVQGPEVVSCDLLLTESLRATVLCPDV